MEVALSTKILAKKVRTATLKDRQVVKDAIRSAGEGHWSNGLRDKLAIQLGLTRNQVSVIKMHLENSKEI